MAVGHTAKQTTHASAVMTQDIMLRSTGKVNCKYTKAACESRESLLLAFISGILVLLCCLWTLCALALHLGDERLAARNHHQEHHGQHGGIRK